MSILCLILFLQYSSEASSTPNNPIKDSITISSKQSFVESGNLNLALTSPEGSNNSVNHHLFQ